MRLQILNRISLTLCSTALRRVSCDIGKFGNIRGNKMNMIRTIISMTTFIK